MNVIKLTIIFIALIFLVPEGIAKSKKKRSVHPTKKVSKRVKAKRKKRRKSKKSSFTTQSLKYINSTQKFISSNWVGLNYGLDSYFSDQSYNRNQNKSRLTVNYGLYKKESSDMNKGFNFGIKVHFPKLSKRLSVTIEKERDEILASRSGAAGAQGQETKESSYKAGVSYLVIDSKYVKTSFDTGIRLTLPLNPFGKFTIYNGFETKYVNIYAGQKFIYYRHEGLSQITQLSFSRRLSKRFFLLQDNSLTWTENDTDFVFRNSLGLSQQFSEKMSFSYTVGANAYIHPTFYYYQYDITFGCNRLLYQKWIYGNLAVGAEFPREKDYAMKKFIMGRIEMLFQ